jgi:nuclear pore complex protein Nup155
MSRGRNILSNAEKEKLAESRKQVAKVLERDANISGRDLFDRLLRQARMQEQELYEEKLADNALIRQRPASFSEVPGGYTPMPAALQQAAQGEYYHSFQGLFPQIHRAWMTIDHVLYLWDYNDPRGSFYLYDGLDQTIIHASLVKSRQGVFEPTPDWLLLLSTPVEVILLGLYRTATDDIDVFETGYSVATDGANLLQIVGTPSGRIFMAGADGFVYELTYGESEGWFYTNKKCTKRNRSRKRDVALQYLSSVVYDSSDPHPRSGVRCRAQTAVHALACVDAAALRPWRGRRGPCTVRYASRGQEARCRPPFSWARARRAHQREGGSGHQGGRAIQRRADRLRGARAAPVGTLQATSARHHDRLRGTSLPGSRRRE